MGMTRKNSLQFLEFLRSHQKKNNAVQTNLFAVVKETKLKPEELVKTLRALQYTGLVKISGPKTRGDLEMLVKLAADAPDEDKERYNTYIFGFADPDPKKATDERAEYSLTSVRLTLLGHAVAKMISPSTPDDAPKDENKRKPPSIWDMPPPN